MRTNAFVNTAISACMRRIALFVFCFLKSGGRRLRSRFVAASSNVWDSTGPFGTGSLKLANRMFEKSGRSCIGLVYSLWRDRALGWIKSPPVVFLLDVPSCRDSSLAIRRAMSEPRDRNINSKHPREEALRRHTRTWFLSHKPLGKQELDAVAPTMLDNEKTPCGEFRVN